MHETMRPPLTKLGANYYIKRDLQPYLPRGYNSPVRAISITKEE